MSGDAQLVHARDLTVRFVSRDATVHAVNGVDFDLSQNETLCILGESGSGKSVTLRAMMRLNPPRRTVLGGTLLVGGNDMLTMPESRLADIRGSLVSMIFQEPMTALDPVFTIGKQIVETILRHEKISHADAQRRALELLELVQIPSAKRRLAAYPHELSGGLRQRAMIAIALSCRPKLLLADEPTTALDATVQIQILLLLRELQRGRDLRHARPGRGRRDRRPDRGDVCGPLHRGRPRGGADAPAAASLRAGPAWRHGACRAARRTPDDDPGRAAEP
jgi:peptide/nickel transport system ATP-binding protein